MQAVHPQYRFLVSLKPERINNPYEADGCGTDAKIKLIAIPCILAGAVVLGLAISAHLPTYFYGIGAIAGVLGLIPLAILHFKVDVLRFTPNHNQIVPHREEEQLQGRPDLDINILGDWFDEIYFEDWTEYPKGGRSPEILANRDKLKRLIVDVHRWGQEEELACLQNICAHLECNPYDRGRVINKIADSLRCSPTVKSVLIETYDERIGTPENLIKKEIQNAKNDLILERYQYELDEDQWHIVSFLSSWFSEKFGLNYQRAIDDEYRLGYYCFRNWPFLLYEFNSWFLEAWTEEVVIKSLTERLNAKLKGELQLGNAIVNMLREYLKCVPEDAHVDSYEWLQEHGFLEFEDLMHLVPQPEAFGGGKVEQEMRTVTSISHKAAIILLIRVGIIADDDELHQRILDDSEI